MHPLDAILQAWVIAGSYAVPPEPKLGESKLSHSDMEWAWRRYRNPEEPVSLKTLAKVLRCRRDTLRKWFIECHGYEYRLYSARRATGGDLFRKFYHRTRA